MQQTSLEFSQNAARAQADADLQSALAKLQRDTRLARPVITGRLPEFEDLRDRAVAIKNHTLANLDHYLETLKAKVIVKTVRREFGFRHKALGGGGDDIAEFSAHRLDRACGQYAA